MRSLRSKNFFTVQCLPGSSLPNRYQYSRRFSNLQEQIVKNAISESIFSFSEEKTKKLTKLIQRTCISVSDRVLAGTMPRLHRPRHRKSACHSRFLRQEPPVSLYRRCGVEGALVDMVSVILSSGMALSSNSVVGGQCSSVRRALPFFARSFACLGQIVSYTVPCASMTAMLFRWVSSPCRYRCKVVFCDGRRSRSHRQQTILSLRLR